MVLGKKNWLFQMYKTLDEVFRFGKSDNITWIKAQRPFTYNRNFFDTGNVFYVPFRAFEKRRDSLTVYSFPDGNLHMLPFEIEGDFVSCEKKTDSFKCFNIAYNTNNEFNSIGNTDNDNSITSNKNYNNSNINNSNLDNHNSNSNISDDSNVNSNSSSNISDNNCNNTNTNSNTLSQNDSFNDVVADYNESLLQNNISQNINNHPFVEQELQQITSTKTSVTNFNNTEHTTLDHEVKSRSETIEENSSYKLEHSDDEKKSSDTESSSDSDDTVSDRIIGHGKIFKPFFKQNGGTSNKNKSAFTIGSHYQRENQSQQNKNMKTNKNKRFSLFSDQEYVTMTSLESFEKMCIKHSDTNGDLSQEDYLSMHNPTAEGVVEGIIKKENNKNNNFANSFFCDDDLFKVKLRKRSKSQLASSSSSYAAEVKLTPRDARFSQSTDEISNHSNHSNHKTTRSGTICNDVSNGGEESDRKARSKSRLAYSWKAKSISDFSQLHDDMNLLDLLPNENKRNCQENDELHFLLQSKGDNVSDANSNTNGNKAKQSKRLSSVLYDRLMDEVRIMLKKDGGGSFDEDVMVEKFNRFEKRLVIHSMQGWVPRISRNQPTVSKQNNKMIMTTTATVASGETTPGTAAITPTTSEVEIASTEQITFSTPTPVATERSTTDRGKQQQTQNRKSTFVEDYTVDEIYHLIQALLGNARLADYLRMYSVDGFLLLNIVRDDLLLDRMLFDDSFIRVDELLKIRLAVFPKRPRCYAIDGTLDTFKNRIVNIL